MPFPKLMKIHMVNRVPVSSTLAAPLDGELLSLTARTMVMCAIRGRIPLFYASMWSILDFGNLAVLP